MERYLIGLAASTTSVLLTLLVQRFIAWWKRREHGALLDFPRKEILFIYPARSDPSADPRKVIVPRTATEDFLAINNVLSALIKVRWLGEVHVKSCDHFGADDKEHDLVLICSPRTNPKTAEALEAVGNKYPGLPRFEREQGSDRWCIRLENAT